MIIKVTDANPWARAGRRDPRAYDIALRKLDSTALAKKKILAKNTISNQQWDDSCGNIQL